MDLAKPGLIQKFCRSNAILTFKEYLIDYAGEETRAAGEEMIKRLIDETTPAGTRKAITSRLARIEKGRRDICM